MNATFIGALTTALAERYRIERELGRGGMATVYLAEDLKHHRRVALKVLHAELAHAVGADRFLREIETTAALHHPHILGLYDSGAAGGFLYYVMPYVEGESLRDRLTREKQLPLDDALQIAREVSDALSYAHSRGVIHRDIKPENILLASGHAMVADFGIARAVTRAGSETLTGTGTAVGTPTYMSPEQAAGERDLDGRSDLYALGCVVYEMLAGQPPFTGPTVESVVHQHLTAEPRSITQIRPAVPAAVAGVLQRALAKNPADRFSPVAQFADALRAGRTETGIIPGAVTGGVPRWPLFLAAALALVVVVLAIGGLRSVSRRGTAAGAGDSTPSIAVLPFVDLSGGSAEYLGDGIAETLIGALASVGGLRVAARTSAFSFKGRNEDVRAIAEALGVRSVLEGSVQRAGDRLRISAQLINAGDGFHLWSQTFDRDVADVFAVQDEVARAVVSALQVRLASGGRVVDQGTESLDAYNAYLQGLFHWNRRTAPDMERAAEYFQQAIAADSSFARAWAGLALAYVLFTPSEYDVRTITPAEALRRAERAARRALAIDSRLAEAHSALGDVFDQTGQLDSSLAAYERAIAADPRYATARQWYASHLAKRGRVAEGLKQMQQAEQLDPLSLVIGVEVAEFLDANGRNAEASAQYEKVLDRYPDAFLSTRFASIHFLAIGNFERASALFERFAVHAGADSGLTREFAARIRQPENRRAALRSALGAEPGRPEDIMAVHLALGDSAGAVAAFERTVDGPAYEQIYLSQVLAILGPELSATPHVQAAIQRFLGRLRQRLN